MLARSSWQRHGYSLADIGGRHTWRNPIMFAASEIGNVIALPTSAGDTPGGTPIMFAASEIGNLIALPTSAGDTPGGTPMAFIASARGMVDGAGGSSGVVSAVIAFGSIVVTAGAWTGSGNEAPVTTLSGVGGLEAVSCVKLGSRGAGGITSTFSPPDPFTLLRNA